MKNDIAACAARVSQILKKRNIGRILPGGPASSQIFVTFRVKLIGADNNFQEKKRISFRGAWYRSWDDIGFIAQSPTCA